MNLVADTVSYSPENFYHDLLNHFVIQSIIIQIIL